MFPRLIFRNAFRIPCRVFWQSSMIMLAISLSGWLWIRSDSYQVSASSDSRVPFIDASTGLVVETVEPITTIHLSGPSLGEKSTVYTYTAEIEPVEGSSPITYTWDATDLVPITNIGGASDEVGLTWHSPGTKTITVTASNEVSSQVAVQTVVIRDSGIKYLPFLQRGCEPEYLEDFSNPDPRWVVEDSANILLEFNNGEYRAVLKNPNWLVAVNPGLTVSASNRLEVDLRNASGVFGSYGLLFGLVPDYTETYLFEIFPDRWYGIWHYHETTGWSLLQDGRSDFIVPGSAVNHMAVTFNDSFAQFYVNGYSVAELPYTPLPGQGNVGLIVFSYDSGNVDIRFDNFRLETANCFGQASYTLQPGALHEFGNPSFMDGMR